MSDPRETLTDLQRRARLAFYAEHYAAFGEWPDTPKDGDVLLVAIRSLLEENERLRASVVRLNQEADDLRDRTVSGGSDD